MTAGQPLRGFVGQSMSGTRRFVSSIVGVYDFIAAATGVVSAPASGFAHVYLWGAGGGGFTGGGSNSGGGGGGAAYKRVSVTVGQTLSYVIAAGALTTVDATDSTVAMPDGTVLRAGGGKGGVSMVGGIGGAASGGDLARSGGTGGNVGAAGAAGMNGAAGGTNALGNAGGGGAAGFTDLPSNTLTGGAGGNGAAAGKPSGGGGGTDNSGGDGRLFIIFETASN